MNRLLGLFIVLFSINASAGIKTCYLEDNIRAFKLIQTSKKDNTIGFTGIELNLKTQDQSAVNGSGYFKDDKMYANLVYQVIHVPTFVFFDMYTMTKTGESDTVTYENVHRKGTLISIPCNLYFP